jgi:hypothetical protein
MCTSNEDPQFIAQAKRKGAVDVLSKSTASEKLESLLQRLQTAVAAPPKIAESAPAASSNIDRPQANEEGLDERIRTLIEPLMDELSQRLTADLISKTEQQLVCRLEDEADQLQKRFIKAQSEQAQLTTNRMINELLPRLIQQKLDEEQQNIARLVQELIDSSLDSLVDEPRFIRRILDAKDAAATGNAVQILRHQAEEIAEAVASKRAAAVTDSILQALRPSPPPMYLLVTGGALVGAISAAVVFFLLS